MTFPDGSDGHDGSSGGLGDQGPVRRFINRIRGVGYPHARISRLRRTVDQQRNMLLREIQGVSDQVDTVKAQVTRAVENPDSVAVAELQREFLELRSAVEAREARLDEFFGLWSDSLAVLSERLERLRARS